MYLLAKHPQYIQKIASELSGYKDVDSLKSVELAKLPYLNAVIRESMRLYPPFGATFGRVCPPEGRLIGGYFVPGGVLPY
jgi:cytochrome P450